MRKWEPEEILCIGILTTWVHINCEDIILRGKGKRSAAVEWLLITQAKSMCVKKSDSQNKNAHSLHY